MSSEEFTVNIPSDDEGMIGRECPDQNCLRYFKIETRPNILYDRCKCPYCGTEDDSNEFFTSDQLEYLKSVVMERVVDPLLAQLERDILSINRRTSNRDKGLIRLDISVRRTPVVLHDYIETQLETDVICNKCELRFAIYGVFGSCPACGELNALKACQASLETSRKKVSLSEDKSLDLEFRNDFLSDALCGSISAFDAFGKTLRAYRNRIRSGAKLNLFQDLASLNNELTTAGCPSIEELITKSAYEELKWFFAARHVYVHNAGVVDSKFTARQPAYKHLLGRKLSLEADRVIKNIEVLILLANKLDETIT